MPIGWQMVNRLALQTFLLTGSKHKFQGISLYFQLLVFTTGRRSFWQPDCNLEARISTDPAFQHGSLASVELILHFSGGLNAPGAAH
jgi:hypothetical protein